MENRRPKRESHTRSRYGYRSGGVPGYDPDRKEQPSQRNPEVEEDAGTNKTRERYSALTINVAAYSFSTEDWTMLFRHKCMFLNWPAG